MKNIFLLINIVVLSSCHYKTISPKTLDDFTKRYQNERFSKFKNTAIFIRSEDFINTIYVIDKGDGKNLPVYFVTYNKWLNKITEINNKMLKEQGIPDYFTSTQIASIINNLRMYKFSLLCVDAQNNIFINPFYINNPAVFLRMDKGSHIDFKKVSGNFIHYKGNWYVDRSQLPGVKF